MMVVDDNGGGEAREKKEGRKVGGFSGLVAVDALVGMETAGHATSWVHIED